MATTFGCNRALADILGITISGPVTLITANPVCCKWLGPASINTGHHFYFLVNKCPHFKHFHQQMNMNLKSFHATFARVVKSDHNAHVHCMLFSIVWALSCRHFNSTTTLQMLVICKWWLLIISHRRRAILISTHVNLILINALTWWMYVTWPQNQEKWSCPLTTVLFVNMAV
jgi:hypothetical protein